MSDEIFLVNMEGMARRIKAKKVVKNLENGKISRINPTKGIIL